MAVVAVTGSASGLGAAVRSELEDRGDKVIGVDLHDAEVVADLATPEGRLAALTGIGANTQALDGLVVAAGLGPHVEHKAAIVAVNYFGAVALLDGLHDLLAAGAHSAAVAVSSNSATIDPTVDDHLARVCVEGDEASARTLAADLAGHSVYASCKVALARAVRRRASLWGAAGVRLNAVAPGPIETPLLQATRDDAELGLTVAALPIPLGRTSAPGEVAGVIVFLLSPTASWVHGSVLFVDGGTDALLRPDAF